MSYAAGEIGCLTSGGRESKTQASNFKRSSVLRAAAVACVAALWCGSAAAQTTVVLNQPDSQVTDTTIRNGAYKNTTGDNQVLVTRASNDPDWERRALLKFDTKNTIPEGAQIQSAILGVTVKNGLGTGSTRPVAAYRVPEPFQAGDATWIRRDTSTNWSLAGGSATEQFSGANVNNVAGTKVYFNVTTLVQAAVNGDFDSRYTRIALVDVGGDAKTSYAEYYASEEPTASRRPTLTITYASPTSSPITGTTLKVLHWNMAQGYGTDGKSNIDRIVNWVVQWRPDVISFNEIMKYSSTNSQAQTIADKIKARTGETWTFKWVQKWGASTGEGEAVMTRLGLDGTDSFLLSASRCVAMGTVTVNGRAIQMFSTHLDQNSSATRLTEVRQLVTWLLTSPDPRIVAGDFNWYPGTTEINEMGKTYYDSWAVAKSLGLAVAYPANPDGNTRNNRIDYVWYSKTTSLLTVKRVQVFDTRDASGYKPSDHNPLMTTFQVR